MINFDREAIQTQQASLRLRVLRERKRLRDEMQALKSTITESTQEYNKLADAAHKLIFCPQEYFAEIDKEEQRIADVQEHTFMKRLFKIM